MVLFNDREVRLYWNGAPLPGSLRWDQCGWIDVFVDKIDLFGGSLPAPVIH